MPEASGLGFEEENVLIQAGDCSATILPKFGCKIASLRVGVYELLQAPLIACGPRTRSMAFDESDASGWDECLPSVAACKVETADGPVSIPDHGDLWRVAWRRVAKTDHSAGESDANSVTFRGECFSLPLALERTVTLKEAGKGWQVRLNYTVTNTGGHPVPWSWAAHPLFTVGAGDRIVLPGSIHTLRLEGSGRGRLGKSGDQVSWPVATQAYGARTDLSVVQRAASAIGDKLFAGPLSEAEHWCALERPSLSMRIWFGFDPAATPYLGLWLCYGGWPERLGPKQMCVALEPSTAPVDSLAVTGPWSRTLAPGQSFSWPMVVEIELLTGIDRHA
jgi:galactose mutarotase-like enzyme